MKVTVIGPSIIDVLASGVGTDIFEKKSHRLDDIRLSFGGNALNESVVLSRLGIDTELITKLGDDESGKKVFDFIRDNGISTDRIKMAPGLKTAINVVLIDKNGERFFLTDPNSNLRKMEYDDISCHSDEMADIVCYPCMFTSPLMGIPEMSSLFAGIKSKPGRTIILDMTNAKNNETICDMKEIFAHTDYFLPNEEELMSISGGLSSEDAAGQILSWGTKAVIIKRGGRDTLLCTNEGIIPVPIYKTETVVDTTGAGDCFGAGFIYGLTKKMSLRDCVLFGNAAASCTIEKTGATDGVVSIQKPLKRFEELSSE
ncbi:MAG: carbohydrate kinase family protein [Lachnospiraceae bacterium]|nr:carbohydrate kinase family protein [Lachnospiraceae bacterium]